MRALLLLATLPALAQAPAPLRLADLAFMAGSWRGTHAQGFVEEHWRAEAGLPMLGMFRRVEAGKVRFAEFMSLAQEADGVRLRIRHFNGDLTQAWEEKDAPMTFRLSAVEAGEARFTGEGPEVGTRLTYRRTPAGLQVALEKAKDGQPWRLQMDFAPSALGPEGR